MPLSILDNHFCRGINLSVYLPFTTRSISYYVVNISCHDILLYNRFDGTINNDFWRVMAETKNIATSDTGGSTFTSEMANLSRLGITLKRLRSLDPKEQSLTEEARISALKALDDIEAIYNRCIRQGDTASQKLIELSMQSMDFENFKSNLLEAENYFHLAIDEMSPEELEDIADYNMLPYSLHGMQLVKPNTSALNELNSLCDEHIKILNSQAKKLQTNEDKYLISNTLSNELYKYSARQGLIHLAEYTGIKRQTLYNWMNRDSKTGETKDAVYALRTTLNKLFPKGKASPFPGYKLDFEVIEGKVTLVSQDRSEINHPDNSDKLFVMREKCEKFNKWMTFIEEKGKLSETTWADVEKAYLEYSLEDDQRALDEIRSELSYENLQKDELRMGQYLPIEMYTQLEYGKKSSDMFTVRPKHVTCAKAHSIILDVNDYADVNLGHGTKLVVEPSKPIKDGDVVFYATEHPGAGRSIAIGKITLLGKGIKEINTKDSAKDVTCQNFSIRFINSEGDWVESVCEGGVELPDGYQSTEELDFEEYHTDVGFNIVTRVVKVTDIKPA